MRRFVQVWVHDPDTQLSDRLTHFLSLKLEDTQHHLTDFLMKNWILQNLDKICQFLETITRRLTAELLEANRYVREFVNAGDRFRNHPETDWN